MQVAYKESACDDRQNTIQAREKLPDVHANFRLMSFFEAVLFDRFEFFKYCSVETETWWSSQKLWRPIEQVRIEEQPTIFDTCG